MLPYIQNRGFETVENSTQFRVTVVLCSIQEEIFVIEPFNGIGPENGNLEQFHGVRC